MLTSRLLLVYTMVPVKDLVNLIGGYDVLTWAFTYTPAYDQPPVPLLQSEVTHLERDPLTLQTFFIPWLCALIYHLPPRQQISMVTYGFNHLPWLGCMTMICKRLISYYQVTNRDSRNMYFYKNQCNPFYLSVGNLRQSYQTDRVSIGWHVHRGDDWCIAIQRK